jgi:hypothetical protein
VIVNVVPSEVILKAPYIFLYISGMVVVTGVVGVVSDFFEQANSTIETNRILGKIRFNCSVVFDFI